jgi:hypothetical protein
MALSDSALDKLAADYDLDRGTAFFCADSLVEGGDASSMARTMSFQHGWDDQQAQKFVADLRLALVNEKLIAG